MQRSRLSSRRSVLALVALLACAAVAIGATSGPGSARARDGRFGGHGPNHYVVGLFGDQPYGAMGKAEYPNVLADLNAHQLAFSVFDGDLKAGGDGACTNDLYTTSLAFFNSLRAPLIFTPGDNDWTDCWGRYGPGTGGFDPEERLAYERQLFFSTHRSLGQQTIPLQRQSDEPGPYAAYSENARWRKGPVVYLTLNVQGSNDNDAHLDVPEDVGQDPYTRSPAEIARQDAEHLARLAANKAWLDESFAYAKSVGARGVMVIWQADPNFNNEQHLARADEYDGFPEILEALRQATMAFSGQVVLVHGDSHYFKVDQPLTSDKGTVLANFTRVETWGAANLHWVSAEIDVNAPTLFTFRSMIVPANVS
jgi:hypothetical protein